MPYYQWSEAMSVGVKALDADHKILISLINQLHEIVHADAPGDLAPVFDDLIRYAAYHFGREENVMRAVGYPGIAAHQSEHRAFESEIHRLRGRALGRDDALVMAALLDYLKGWLNHHILMIDIHYKKLAAGDPRAEAAARAFGSIATDAEASGA